MSTIARENVIVEFIAKTGKFINARRKLFAETEKETQKVTSRFSRIADVAGGIIGAQVIQGALSGMVSLGAQAIQLSKDYEQTKVSFEVLTGSVSNATKLLADLDKFSLKTPFEPTEINNSAKTLLGFGRSISEVKEDLAIIGEASAATGADLQNLAVVFGQVAGAGKLQGQDALQLINAGIPVYDLLSDSLNLNTGQLKALQAQGKITFDDLREAFDKARQEGGKFENALIKQSTTFAGLASTATGAGKAILRNLGDALLPLVREVLPVIIDGLFELVEVAKRVSEPLGSLFIGAFRLISTAVQPVTAAIGRLFSRFDDGRGILERLQPSLNFVAQLFTVLSRVVGLAVDAVGLFFHALSNDEGINSLTQALSTIPAVIGGIIRVIETVPTAVTEAFLGAKQSVSNFIDDVAQLLNPFTLAAIVSGRTSIAEILAKTEAKRIAEGQQEFKGLGASLADAYAAGYSEIENIEFEIPPVNTPANIKAASDDGEDLGKEVASGMVKGMKEKIAETSLAGLKKQLSDLEKALTLISDPTADGIDKVLETLDAIAKQKEAIATVEELIDRVNGDFDFDLLTVDPLKEEELIDSIGRIAQAEHENFLAYSAALKTRNAEEKAAAKERAELVKAEAINALGLALDLADQVVGIQQDRVAKEISLQEDRLSELLSIADQGNAEQVQLEQDRLRKLQLEQEKATQAKQRIAAIEIATANAVTIANGISAITAAFAVNPLLGVATAASLGLTVASTILTLSNAFSDIPSFRVGVENFQPSSDDGTGGHPAMLHRGERVLTASQNKQLTAWGISNEEIPDLIGIALGRIKAPDVGEIRPQRDISAQLELTRRSNRDLISAIKNNRPSIVFDEKGLRIIGEQQARRLARKKSIRRG